jgi:hypothetical protein
VKSKKVLTENKKAVQSAEKNYNAKSKLDTSFEVVLKGAVESNVKGV